MATPSRKRHLTPTKLQTLCRIWNFNDIIQRCLSQPLKVAVEAQRSDSRGLLPLHWIAASSSKSTLRSQATKSVLDAYPDGAAALDIEGRTPLHHACKFGHIQRDSDKPNLDADVSKVFENLIEAYPAALSMRDKFGRAPVEYAITRQPATGVLRVLISSDPNLATFVPTKTRQQSKSCEKFHLQVAWDYFFYEKDWELCPERWDNAMLLLKAVYHCTTNLEDENDFLLHAALSFHLPQKVIDYAFKMQPDALLLPVLDTSIYPFMLAATYAPNGEENEEDDDLHQINMIFDLLTQDPSVPEHALIHKEEQLCI
mmetsp:Transcript_19936/g.26352  ORF Transcript_19936/g.26352 Transcript_19936/m.26352 type:complete len:314 (+) Transcript_19936:72-1013(+)